MGPPHNQALAAIRAEVRRHEEAKRCLNALLALTAAVREPSVRGGIGRQLRALQGAERRTGGGGMDGRGDGQREGWMDRGTEGGRDGQRDGGCVDGRMDGGESRQADRWRMDGWGRMDGQTDR